MSSDGGTKVAQGSGEPGEPTPSGRRGPQDPMGVLGKTIRLVFSYYPVHFVIIVACILAAAMASSSFTSPLGRCSVFARIEVLFFCARSFLKSLKIKNLVRFAALSSIVSNKIGTP